MRLAGRLALCQIFGTLAAIIFGRSVSSIWSSDSSAVSLFGGPLQDFVVVSLVALGFGVPFYFIALLILQVEISAILKRPVFWCIGIPAVLSALALAVFQPARVGGIFWIALIPLSALFAGMMFYVWLRRSPIILT